MGTKRILKPKTQEEIDKDIWKSDPEDALISCMKNEYIKGLEMLLEVPGYVNNISVPDLNNYNKIHTNPIAVDNYLSLIKFVYLAQEYKSDKIMNILKENYPIETMFFRDVILKNYKDNIIFIDSSNVYINYNNTFTTISSENYTIRTNEEGNINVTPAI